MRDAKLCALGAFIALLCLSGTSSANLTMRAQIGWDGVFRVGRWTPIYITLADDQAFPARNVQLDIIAPHDNTFAMRVRQYVAVRPEASTFILYAPLTFQAGEAVAVVRDAKTGRSLGELPFDSVTASTATYRSSWYGAESDRDLVIGISGRGNALGLIAGPFYWVDKLADQQLRYGNSPQIRTGFLQPQYLPDASLGYDGLDVLVLNAPDLVTMPLQTQQAIARWVRGGGRLLMWPSAGPVPADSPIIDLLPCKIGQSTAIPLSLDDTKALDLPARQERIAAREIELNPSAKKVSILLDKALACYGRAGLGRVAVLSIDASQLGFQDRNNALKFWRPILKNLVAPTIQPTDESNDTNPNNDTGSRRLAAMEAVVDRLGDVPGIGRFDFSYIAIVMVAMMFVVGPIDWFVLKKLGKQPWTWATTAGWIVLITVGALYIGYIFRSGDLYYRTVRLIDQADDQVVGVMDVAGIYSPKTQVYDLDGAKDAWWEPANLDALTPWNRSSRTATEILTGQDTRGNRPQSMVVNIWSLRFMQSELGDPAAISPPLHASLTRTKAGADGKVRIVGSITNRSTALLSGVIIRTAAGLVILPDAIKPNESAMIDLPINSDNGIFKLQGDTQYSNPRYGRNTINPYSTDVRGPMGFMLATCDLAVLRSRQIETVLTDQPEMASICAQSQDITPTVKLRHRNAAPPIQQHYQVVRALVELTQVEQP
ncbi:MAG: hypothetical protein NTU53_07465 [Planctomycetota bacterium]|nr:hypothetical protein [Planctomycetota bacterium]